MPASLPKRMTSAMSAASGSAPSHSMRAVIAAPWATQIGATVASTGSDGQTSALTRAFTRLDLPFLNSPTTATVTRVRSS